MTAGRLGNWHAWWGSETKMSAPDSEPRPEDADLSAEALAAGKRVLAAIVFTDTVNFSLLMAKHEELTLRIVARDLGSMKTTCAAFGGHVLKSTGDGLLMLFTSAVQAVACALEIQRDVAKRNLELPPNERLQHRIGIHLGDVFRNENDVMGDGVNIAARLQTEAVPGGICLSKTVYEVVHNRLPFYVNELGERRLKNIGKVTAYQISPNDNRHLAIFRWHRWAPWAWAAAGFAALALTLFLVFRLGMYEQGAPAANAPVASTVPIPIPAPTPVANVPSPAPHGGAVITVTEQDFEAARVEHLRDYDFQGMMEWITTHDWPGKSASLLLDECHDLQHLFRWTQEQLHAYAQDTPLVLPNPDGGTTEIWTVAFGGLRMRSGGETKTLIREEIAPALMEQIVLKLLSQKTVSADDRVHFVQDLSTFHELYADRSLKTPSK